MATVPRTATPAQSEDPEQRIARLEDIVAQQERTICAVLALIRHGGQVSGDTAEQIGFVGPREIGDLPSAAVDALRPYARSLRRLEKSA